MIKERLSEAQVLARCLAFLRVKRIFAWRNNTGASKVGKRFLRFGLKGSSDIIGIAPDGRFLAIECKCSCGGYVTKEQVLFLEEITVRGGVACVVHSVDELEAELTKWRVI